MISCVVECGGRITQVRARLSNTFNSEFLVWMQSATGWCLLDDRPSLGGGWSEQYLEELRGWFDCLSNEGNPYPQSRRIGALMIVATLSQTDNGDSVVIAGRIQVDPLQLVERTATMVLEEAEHAVDASMQQLLVDQYADRLSDSYEELSFLRRLSRHVEYCSADRSLASAANAILPQLRELAELEGLCLVGVDKSTGHLLPGEVLGISGSIPKDEMVRTTIASMGSANRRVLVNNYLSDLADKRVRPIEGVRSIVVVPVEKDGDLFGWLVGCNKASDGCSNRADSTSRSNVEIGSIEASLLEAAALMLGSHAANNRLFREKESLVVEVIHTLVGVIEAKDVYTCGHSDRVALIASRLGAELKLSDQECQDIFLSGLLHDIGKIGIADDILLKPGKLSEDEFAQVKLHPERGARLLRGLKPLERLIPGVLHHHEAIDGSGYPLGLKGDSIPTMARILAVADAFDAMTSDRPYRAGMPLSKAEEILRNGAGKQWDANVVEAYFSARTEILDIGKDWQNHLHHLLSFRTESSVERQAFDPVWFGCRPSATVHEDLV